MSEDKETQKGEEKRWYEGLAGDIRDKAITGVIFAAFAIMVAYFIEAPLKNCTEEFDRISNKVINAGTLYSQEKYKESLGEYENSRKEIDEKMRGCLLCEGKYTKLYGQVLIGIGDCYGNISENDITKDSIRSSKKAYENALKTLGGNITNSEKAKITNNIGVAYLELSRFEDTKDNLDLAIKAFRFGLTLWGKESNRIEEGKTLYNLGISLLKISEFTQRQRNLDDARNTLEQAKEKFKDVSPLEYAQSLDGLASVYVALSDITNKEGNLGKASEKYKESLKAFPIEKDLVLYGIVEANLGSVYASLYEITKNKADRDNSSESFENAAVVFKGIDNPYYYAQVKYMLADSYVKMSRVEYAYIWNALEACNEAMSKLNLGNYPVDCAETLRIRGDLYKALSAVSGAEDHFKEAIKSYKEASLIFDDFPYKYAEIQEDLGDTYLAYSYIRDTVDNRKNAAECYWNALKIYANSKEPEDRFAFERVTDKKGAIPK
jgi:tetratricopeptide (TPR) repeat protein